MRIDWKKEIKDFFWALLIGISICIFIVLVSLFCLYLVEVLFFSLSN